jgi:hypothetical protein
VLNLLGAELRVSIPAAGALVTAYAPGLGIGEPIDRADGWNLVAGVSLHRPRSVPPYVPDIGSVAFLVKRSISSPNRSPPVLRPPTSSP